MATALWEAHRRREAARLAGLSNKPAHPGLAVLDTWALRFVPILPLIVADRHRRRLAHRSHGCRLHAGLPAAAAGGRQSVDRAAGLYRQAADLSRHGRPRQAAARAGRQQARGLRRRRARPQAAAAGDRRQGHRVRAPSARASTRSSRSSPRASKITLQARGDEQARWKLHVIPDLAPTIEFAKPIGVDKWSTKIEYIAGDDFGVTGVQLQIRLHGTRAGRRHAERRRGARGAARRPAGRRQYQEGRRHLRARPHQPSVGRPQGHGDAVRHRCAGPEGPQRGRDLPAARARVQRSDGACADRAAQGADARSQGACGSTSPTACG